MLLTCPAPLCAARATMQAAAFVPAVALARASWTPGTRRRDATRVARVATPRAPPSSRRGSFVASSVGYESDANRVPQLFVAGGRHPKSRGARVVVRGKAPSASDSLASNTPPPGPSLVTQVLSGITVSLAMVPESLAFTFVAGVSPIVGLHAAALMGLTTAVLGAQPGVISGAAGATAVVFAPLVASHGVEYLFAAVALAGFIQLVAGALRLGKFIRLVPQPCMIGFVNGLAIVIGAAQLEAFRGLTGEALYVQMGLAAFTIALIRLLPEVPFIPKQIPSPLAAVMACAGLVRYLGVSAKTVGDVAPVSGALPSFHLPAVPATWDTFTLLAPVAASVAAVGLIETLLTQQLVDDVTERRTSTHREVMAQGAANLLNGVFGGMGGCAMIGQSMLNVESGGRTRVAGLTCGAAILGYVTFGSAFIEGVPIAALAGTMLSLVFDIFDWTSFARLRKIPKTDAVVIALVTGVTVACNLAVAVFAGVVLSALGFAWKSSRRIEAPRTTDANFGGPTTAVYRLAGPLFFGSARGFLERLDPKNEKLTNVVVDFAGSKVWDSSALVAIDDLASKYRDAGKTLRLRHLSRDCAALLERAGDLVEVDAETDPVYAVAADYGANALVAASEAAPRGGARISVDGLEAWEEDALRRQYGER